MNAATKPPFAFFEPGAPFLIALFVLLGLLVGAHTFFRRRLGAERLDIYSQRIEGTVFCVVLGVMIVLSALQVVLRNVFHSGVLWADPLVRTLVLWLAFLGALAATSRGRHLHIDVIQRALSPSARGAILRVLSVVSAVFCALLANAAYIYLLAEREDGGAPFLDLPSWITQSVLFWGFGALAYRFVIAAIWPRVDRERA